MKAIMAVDDKMGIGKDGKIPWHFKEDLKFFKFMTVGSTVIMGRKTYEDCGILPNRMNIIISSSLKRTKDALVYHNLTSAFNDQNNDGFIIGGSQLLKSAFEEGLITELFLSRIKGVYDCDTFSDLPLNMMLKVSELKLSNNVIVEKWIL